MTTTTDLLEITVSRLMIEEQFDDLTFVVAYEKDIKPTPVTKPIVALSIKDCEISSRLTEVEDTGEIVTTMSRNTLATLSIDIYLPYSMGGSYGHRIFDRLATYFINDKGYDFTKAGCGSTDYDQSCEAIILKTYFTFSDIVTK